MDIRRGTNDLIIGGIVGGLFGLHLISLGCFTFGGAFLLIYAKKHERAEDFILDFILFAFVGFILGYLFSILSYLAEDSLITPPPHGGGIAGGLAFAILGLIPIFNILLGIIFGGNTGYLLGSLIDPTSWINAPIFVVPLFAFVGYGISKAISITEIKKEEWIRKKEEQRLREEEEMRRREEQRRKEQERNEVKNLIDETKIIIETAIHDATNANDSLWLSALKLLQFDFLDFAQELESGDFSYNDDMARILDLKEQAEVLRTLPSKFEKFEEKSTYYDILSVAPNASHEEIKKARNEKVKKLHPEVTARWAKTDKMPQEVKEFLNEMSQKINEAYEVLSDPDKRREYDEKIGI